MRPHCKGRPSCFDISFRFCARVVHKFLCVQHALMFLRLRSMSWGCDVQMGPVQFIACKLSYVGYDSSHEEQVSVCFVGCCSICVEASKRQGCLVDSVENEYFDMFHGSDEARNRILFGVLCWLDSLSARRFRSPNPRQAKSVPRYRGPASINFCDQAVAAIL